MKKLSNSSRNYLIQWLKPEWLSILLLSLGNIALSGLTVCFSLASRTIVDDAVSANYQRISTYAVVLVVISAGTLFLQASMSNISETAKARMKNRIRSQMLDEILHKDFSAVSKYHSGELVNRILSDVRVIAEGVVGIVPPLLGMASRLCMATIVLWQFDPRFTVLLLVLGVVMMLGGLIFKRRMKQLHKNVQNEEDSVHASFSEMLGNLRFIKASGIEQTMEDNSDKRQKRFFDAQMKRKRFSIFMNVGFGATTEICWLLTLVWGCVGIAGGTISFGTLTAMMQLVGQVQSPLSGIPTVLQRFYAVSASVERLEEILTLDDERDLCIASTDQRKAQGFRSVSFQDLQFSYDRNFALKGIDGDIKSGDFIAITGLSGGGKTTLFLLLLGIYQPSNGRLEIHTGEGICSQLALTRHLFSYVPQGNTLFTGSIRENLSLLCRDASDEMLWNAARVSCIDDFISSLPDKMETHIGERGLGLSEGQAQRLAIARAIVGGAPILLLDESTSALDETTEAMLLTHLAELKNKTCLIVTHRRAALSICNKQLQIIQGYGQINDLTPNSIEKTEM